MITYYARIALRSLARNPVLSGLMVLAIGLGIGASMTTYAAFRAVGSDPIPWKSHQLFVPQIDGWGPGGRDTDGEPPDALNYTDGMALMHAHAAPRQSLLYPVGFSVIPDDPAKRAFSAPGHAVYKDFFAMVDAPFRQGAAWSAEDDQDRAPVAVISGTLADTLFGKDDPIGRSIDLDGNSLRVVGVLKPWNPQPRYYDMVNSDAFGKPEDVFVPFSWALEHQISTAGSNNCNHEPDPGWDGWLHSTCVWLTALVELPTAADATHFRAFLDQYAREQQSQGRYGWAPNNRLRDIPQWLDHEHVVPDEVRVLMLIAFGFLAVCLVNVVGLMLAKFLRRSAEIGVRRALGASRREIYLQFMVEAGVIGLAGGGLGFALMLAGKIGIRALFDQNVQRLAQFDPRLMVLTLLLSLATTLVAGLYPTARAAGVRPALQLKSN